MKTWNIPVSYSVHGIVCIEADTLEDALEIARSGDVELPDDQEYIDDSWYVEDDEDYIRRWYNHNEPDDTPDNTAGKPDEEQDAVDEPVYDCDEVPEQDPGDLLLFLEG